MKDGRSLVHITGRAAEVTVCRLLRLRCIAAHLHVPAWVCGCLRAVRAMGPSPLHGLLASGMVLRHTGALNMELGKTAFPHDEMVAYCCWVKDASINRFMLIMSRMCA